jgi:hypothetical protein
MKRLVLIFGLIAGLVPAAMFFLVTLPFNKHSEVLGYSSMVLGFVMVFLGIRAYRRDHGGTITFGKGVQVGLLITLVACAVYVGAWEIYYWNWGGNFIEQYSAHVIAQAQREGKAAAEIAAMRQQMSEFAVLYRNPLINVGMTFLEIFPVGLIMTLISAAILRRREPESATA